MKVEVYTDKSGHRAVRVRGDNPYGGADDITALEAERLADELRRAARDVRGGPRAKKLGDY